MYFHFWKHLSAYFFILNAIHSDYIRFCKQYLSVLMIQRDLFEMKLSNAGKHGQYFRISRNLYFSICCSELLCLLLLLIFARLSDRASIASSRSLRFWSLTPATRFQAIGKDSERCFHPKKFFKNFALVESIIDNIACKYLRL